MPEKKTTAQIKHEIDEILAGPFVTKRAEPPSVLTTALMRDADTSFWAAFFDDGEVFTIPGTTRGGAFAPATEAEATMKAVKAGWLAPGGQLRVIVV